MMKWPKRKEAVMKETFSKTSTTHKARTNELKDCYRDFIYSVNLITVLTHLEASAFNQNSDKGSLSQTLRNRWTVH